MDNGQECPFYVLVGVDLSELLIVEGESAFRAVSANLDRSFQTVVAMQGKPINALNRSGAVVLANPSMARLLSALVGADRMVGLVAKDLDQVAIRFERVAMLFDPDADGIHCGGLMTAFFDRYFRSLIGQGRLWMIRPPMYEVRLGDEVRYLDTPDQWVKFRDAAAAAGLPIRPKRYRGLASLDAAVLRDRCLNPATRRAAVVTAEDAAAFGRVFG